MMKRILLLSGLVLMAVGVRPVWADVDLYTQPLENVRGTFSNGEGGIADNFRLSHDVRISGARWYGFYGPSFDLSATTMDTIDFTVTFLNHDPDTLLPGAELWTGTVSATFADTGLVLADPADGGLLPSYAGVTIYEFEASFAPITIEAWTMMWLSITENDDDTPHSGDTQWLWSGDGITTWSRTASRSGPEDTWSRATYRDMAYVLTGEEVIVPVPGAALLGVLGLSTAGWRLRRTRA
jgi:hypothetical protein